MRCRSEYARLCCLINRTLSPFTTEQLRQLCSLTKEKEKNLLIILSQISREIQRWDDEVGVVECSGDYHHCLPSIVSLLVLFLNAESRYVRHATTNVLVVISNFLVTSGGEWDGFLHLLFACFEVSMSNILASASVITPSAESDGDSSSYILCMRKQMVNANWCTLAGLVRALRTILKHLKKCPDGELAKVYMSFVDCLTNVPGELLNVMYVAQINDSQMSSYKDVFLHGDVSSSASLFVLLGSLLQLLCSLIHESSSTEVGTFDEHPIFGKLTNLVPKLLHWCFREPKESNWTCSFRYLRHKMLMIMIRLSFHIHREFNLLVLWLQLVHKYFEDLLHQPISGCHADQDDCLEGSPFIPCVVDGGNRISISHLQRQAIFLFLKCSISLISLDKGAGTKCSCASSNSCLTSKFQYGQDCCALNKGLSQLSEWINRHVPLDKVVDYEMYIESCASFALSLLKLYMDEDDFLFEILLHLSSLPFSFGQMDYKGRTKVFNELKGDILYHLSNVLNPVCLFHIFLAELHYDHLVLLDYLISRDAGVHCLQYLLRSLRTVCNSWNLFLNFPVCRSETFWFSGKRKFSSCGSDSDDMINISSASEKEGNYPGVFENGSSGNSKFGSMLNDTRRKNFQNAKECLLSLKTSVENLHQKNLFPYNPAALLRSFTRFQELCHQ